MARSNRSAKKNGNSITVDLSDVESGGKVGDGDYLVEVLEVESKDSSTGNPMLVWKFKVVEGGNGTLYHNTSLQAQALFNLRNVLESLEVEIPDEAFDIDLEEMIGLQCGVTVENEVYQGKKRPRVIDFFSASDFDPSNAGGSEEEEEEAPKAKSKPAKAEAKKSSKKVVEEEAEEEEAEIVKGSKVTFEDDGEEFTGTVIKIDTKENFAEVKVKGEEGTWEIDLSDLTLA